MWFGNLRLLSLVGGLVKLFRKLPLLPLFRPPLVITGFCNVYRRHGPPLGDPILVAIVIIYGFGKPRLTTHTLDQDGG